MRKTQSRVCVILAFLIFLGAVASWADQQNGAGGALSAVTIETDSAAPALSNAANATVALAGAAQAGPDLQNAAGARLYVGHLDPVSDEIIVPPETGKSPIWLLY